MTRQSRRRLHYLAPDKGTEYVACGRSVRDDPGLRTTDKWYLVECERCQEKSPWT